MNSHDDFPISDSELESLLNETSFGTPFTKETVIEKKKEKRKSEKSKKEATTPRNSKRKRAPAQPKINIDDLLEDIQFPPKDMVLQTPKATYSPIQSSPQSQSTPPQAPTIFFQVQRDLEEYIQSSFFSLQYEFSDFLESLIEKKFSYKDIIDSFINDLKENIRNELVFEFKESKPDYFFKSIEPCVDSYKKPIIKASSFEPVVIDTQWITRQKAILNIKKNEIDENEKKRIDFSSLLNEMDDLRRKKGIKSKSASSKIGLLQQERMMMEIRMELLDNEINHVKGLTKHLMKLNENESSMLSEDASMIEDNSEKFSEIMKEMELLGVALREEAGKTSQFLSSTKRDLESEYRYFMNNSLELNDGIYELVDSLKRNPIKPTPKVVLVEEEEEEEESSELSISRNDFDFHNSFTRSGINYQAYQEERAEELRNASKFLHQKMKAELYHLRSSYKPQK